jgi:hypothetical protein
LHEGPEVTALRAALAAALATRHPTATATEDDQEHTARYLATLAKEARDARPGRMPRPDVDHEQRPPQS